MTVTSLTKTGTEQCSEYPLSDIAYDIISILYEKSRGLEIYQKAFEDLQHDTQLRQILWEICNDDRRHIEILKSHLARVLLAERSPQVVSHSEE